MKSKVRGVINGKAGKAASLPKFSDTLTLYQLGGIDYAYPLALLCQKKIRDYAPEGYLTTRCFSRILRRLLLDGSRQ